MGKIKFQEIDEEVTEEEKESVLAIIGRRITLSDEKEIREKDFISFLNQKIGEEGKKDEKKEEGKNEDDIPQAAKKGRCPCCNC